MAIEAINSRLARPMLIDYPPISPLEKLGSEHALQPVEVEPTLASHPHHYDSIGRMPCLFSPLVMPVKMQLSSLDPCLIKSILAQIENGKKDPRNYSELTRLNPKLL